MRLAVILRQQMRQLQAPLKQLLQRQGQQTLAQAPEHLLQKGKPRAQLRHSQARHKRPQLLQNQLIS
ncbi:hypothetical protein [Leucobacter sp. OH1287]|uniref:hypothetical protein n=1 Tax=Leucobacter sp. OH1287 TaxID=2491049 RepID=UPI0013157A57|nr:hypothetical protein [Leucobacter sp. OH1287]